MIDLRNTLMPGHKILYCDRNKFLSYSNGKIYYDDECVVTIPDLSYLKKLMCRIRLLNRSFRLEPRAVEKLDEVRFVMDFRHSIWIINVKEKTIKEILKCRPGFSGTLSFCSNEGSVYWGDYGPNFKRAEVKIYKLDKNEKLTVLHSFSPGEVRHIHNIIWDSIRHKFWILTGDTNSETKIILADRDWQRVEEIVSGDQKYRAVIGFPYKDGLIYATDKVESDNFIYYLDVSDNSLTQLMGISGSCIYGYENKQGYYFSTTVEPTEISPHPRYLYTRGKGIKSWNAELIKVSKPEYKIEKLLSLKKDNWPMLWCKYGCFTFPNGQEDNQSLIIYPVAVKKYDGKNIIIES